MPREPRGEKRPADVIGNAVKVMRIATGEETEELHDKSKSAAAELGSLGGKARAAKMTPERRREIAKRAAENRWRPVIGGAPSAREVSVPGKNPAQSLYLRGGSCHASMEGQSIMTDDPVELDEHRGMAAQKSTEIRRRLHQVQADQAALRRRQEEFERHALAAPSVTWAEAAAEARYLILLFAETSEARNPRRQELIAKVLDDLARLSD